MKVAISVTKVFDVGTEFGNLDDLSKVCEQGKLDWYDVEAEQEIWSYAIVES